MTDYSDKLSRSRWRFKQILVCYESILTGESSAFCEVIGVYMLGHVLLGVLPVAVTGLRLVMLNLWGD